MKRRTFLQALGAATVATTLPGHSALSDEVTEFSTSPGHYRALITANSGAEANEIWTAMGRPADIKIIGPGASLCGMGTDMLILAHEPDTHFWAKQHELNERWINESCRTRLMPGGDEVRVHFTEDEFAWGTQCALAASFLNLNDASYRRQACRFLVPIERLTYDKRTLAKAQLLTWYIESPPPIDRMYS